MKTIQKILYSLNPVAPCRKYRIPLWQCPQFLFPVMGIIIMVAIVSIYFLATLKIDDPKIVSLIALIVGATLLVIDYIIVNSFERLAEASRMKTEFIGIVSHQLRSPLTNLKFALEVIMSGRLKETGESEIEYLKILKENTQKMGDLINELLLLSRIETGELLITSQRTSLGDLTRKLILKFKPFADASNVTVLLDIEKGLPDIMIDSLWLEEVVKNLLDNAIRYTKGRGEVKIKIKKKGDDVYFEIKDVGVGIPQEDQKYIFKKFFRSKNVVRHQTEGSGLGLHITRRLLELFGGKIWFKSEEGKGTTFYFTLPIKLI